MARYPKSNTDLDQINNKLKPLLSQELLRAYPKHKNDQ